MLIAEVIIPQMFTAFAQDLGYSKYNGLHHKQYYCKKCNQSFGAAWGLKPGCYWRVEYGDVFHCPKCGTQHGNHVVMAFENNEELPDKVRLTVKEYQDVVVFEVNCKTIYFSGVLIPQIGCYKEIFRFDIKKQSVTFYKNSSGVDRETVEIGNPFDISLFDKSILWYFQPFSLANANHKKELNRILKVLREAVHNKLEKRLGHKISSMFVSPGQEHGSFLLPILNIAYRVTFPDAPNLTTIYRERKETIERFWSAKLFKKTDIGYMDDVMALRRQKGFIHALITVNKLPDTPYIRRVLTENQFDVVVLAKVFRLCSNYDYAVRLFEAWRKLKYEMSVRSNGDLLKFLRLMKAVYGEAGIVRLVEKAKEVQIWNCISIYNQLTKENKKAVKTERVRLRDLHDWLSIRHKKQNHINLKFDVPEHIVKRLSMQRDRLSFFLPKESMQLLEAGHELHNCVASYGAAMKDNRKWIVLVADDNGRLTACLEVQGRELIQAKLDRNKPVSTNPKLNAEVLEWAKKAKLKINTSDIDEKTELRVALA